MMHNFFYRIPFKVIFKRRKLSDFQREATKENSKNETCDHKYSTRLARAKIHERNFSRKLLL